MRTFVISGINLFEGGPLSIFYDCLDEIIRSMIYKQYSIIAFVYKKELFIKYSNIIKFIELPKSRESYFNRLKYEYNYFYRFSCKYKVDVWLSLHDITPRVKAEKIYTYCHNPTPFMKKDLSKIKYSFRNVAFSFLYKYLYRINIKSADAIIVQQDWMRNEFVKMYPVKKVIVARPNINISFGREDAKKKDEKKIFLFVSYPRYFKNYEVICEAIKDLSRDDYEIWLTIDGDENVYSNDLRQKYLNVKNIKWMGLQSRDSVFRMYNQVDCLIFPSTLETWGLPISEFKITGKPMILADLPYAHETLGTYDKCMFFDPYDAKALRKCVIEIIEGKNKYTPQIEKKVSEPYAENWNELLTMILDLDYRRHEKNYGRWN